MKDYMKYDYDDITSERVSGPQFNQLKYILSSQEMLILSEGEPVA